MNKDNIVRIFQLQDAITKKYLKEDFIITNRFNFCIDCLNWTYDFLTRNQKTKNEKIISPIFTDSFSSVIASINVGLWGLTIDSRHLLRPVLEFLSIGDYIIDNDKFIELTQVKTSLNRSKLSFDYLRNKNLLDKELMKMWKKISEQASHATLERILNGKFEMNGKSYNRVGCAYNPQETRLLFGEICRVNLYMTRIASQLLSKKGLLKMNQEELESKYKQLKTIP
jgi:hypothetical protein